MTALHAAKATPWGRFTLVSKDPAEDSDHIYFTNHVTTIGRNKRRCDLVLNQLFISSVVRYCGLVFATQYYWAPALSEIVS